MGRLNWPGIGAVASFPFLILLTLVERYEDAQILGLGAVVLAILSLHSK